jgi:hypothetical protein
MRKILSFAKRVIYVPITLIVLLTFISLSLFVLSSFQNLSSSERLIIFTKQWFESTYPNPTFLQQSVQVNWSLAKVHKIQGDIAYVIAPLSNSGIYKYAYASNNSTNANSAIDFANGITHLVVSTSDGISFKAFISRMSLSK